MLLPNARPWRRQGSDLEPDLPSRARGAAAPAQKASSSARARVKSPSTRDRANTARRARKLAGTVSAKGSTDEWEIIVTVDEAKPGGQLDVLLRREQATAVYDLAAKHARGAQPGQTADQE